MAATVFVYPEKTSEELGAVRWQAEWSEVSANAIRRNNMKRLNMKWKHEQAGHEGLLENCEHKGCESYHYSEIDPDGDIDTYRRNFKGQKSALEFAQKEVNKGKTAYGSVMVYKQVVDWYVEEDRIAEWTTVGDGEELTAA
jgi:hypothetical protein